MATHRFLAPLFGVRVPVALLKTQLKGAAVLRLPLFLFSAVDASNPDIVGQADIVRHLRYAPIIFGLFIFSALNGQKEDLPELPLERSLENIIRVIVSDGVMLAY